jgi:hypothetical protein
MLADKDVDAGIASDWKDIQAKYAVEEVAAPEPVEPEVEAAKESIPVSREADGKFKANDAKDEKPKVDAKAPKGKDPTSAPGPAGEETAQSDAAGVPAQGLPSDTPQARDINRAPSTWKPTARAEYDKLPPAIKTEIHRREADFLNGQAQLAPDATLGKNMRQVIEPYRMLIESEGGTPERAVADLMRTAAIFRTGSVQQKYQAVAEIAQQFGIDLRYLSQAATEQQGQVPQGQQPQQFRDPRVDQLLAQQNADRQANTAREQQQTESTVTRWMNEQDAQGNPKRPYLGDVINEMSALVPQLRQNDPTLTHGQALDAAYERAIWAHPEIRGLLQQQQQTDLEAKRLADNQLRVREAKRAGSVNVARRASTPAPGKPGTLEETITNTARELGLIT